MSSGCAADGRTPTDDAATTSGVAHGASHRLASLATVVVALCALAACASVERTRINDWIELEQSTPRVVNQWLLGDALGHGSAPGLRTPNCAGHLGDD